MNTTLISILLFALFSFSVFAQSNWYTQNSGVNRELTDVSFIDENTGWISGWTGTILKTTDGGQTWNALPNVPPTNAYFSVSFTDAMNGWASGYAGKIIHTSDGGQTWVDQTAPYTTDYYKVYFVNSTTGWIAGGDAGGFPSYIPHRVILYTSNGGATWTQQYGQAYKSLLKSIYFVDQYNGYATGESGIIMKTTDGGTNWMEQTVISSFHFYDIFFANSTTGWVIGEYLGVPHYAAIFKTTDGGNSWNETSLGMNESLSGIYFTDTMHGWAVGGDSNNEGIIYYTSDGGNNWTMQNIPSVEFLYRVFFVDGTKGWASGHLGTILAYESLVPVELTSFTANVDEYDVVLNWQTATEKNNSGFEILRSTNNDKNWDQIGFVKGNGTTTEPKSYSFTDKNLESGIYSYKLVQIDFDGTQNESEIVTVETTSQPTEYFLSQNYPNPFNPSTTIEYSIPESDNVKLEVYSSIGEEVSTLINNYQAAGNHRVNFYAAGLPSGLYFYKLEVGNFSAVKKMIILK